MSLTVTDWLTIAFLGIVAFVVAVFFGSPAPQAIGIGIIGTLVGAIRVYLARRSWRR
jgi:uncharacterized membrane protein YjjP (DUF1212 family)